MLLVVIDAYSKWLDVAIINSATSTATIDSLRRMFATHGIPESIVSDNATVFTSEEFTEFVTMNGIHHIRSAPYHPATNGLAERAVQTLKESLKKTAPGSLQARVSRFLFTYRITPHTTTGVSPAELLMGRQLRSHLSLLHPDTAMQKRVIQKQQSQKKHHDLRTKSRCFNIGDTVYVRDFPSGKSWLPGTLTKCRGPLAFMVKLDNDRIVHRHVDHIRDRVTSVSPPNNNSHNNDWADSFTPAVSNAPLLRRSTRIRRAPAHFTAPNF